MDIFSGELAPAASTTGSYGTYGTGNYGYAPEQGASATYARGPASTAGLIQAYTPATQQASPAPYGYGGSYRPVGR